MNEGGLPVRPALTRIGAGSLAIFSSSATLRRTPGGSDGSLCATVVVRNVCQDSLSENDGSGTPTGVSLSMPSSCAIALAAEPCLGPATKNWAPVSGSDPGGVASPSGLDLLRRPGTPVQGAAPEPAAWARSAEGVLAAPARGRTLFAVAVVETPKPTIKAVTATTGAIRRRGRVMLCPPCWAVGNCIQALIGRYLLPAQPEPACI